MSIFHNRKTLLSSTLLYLPIQLVDILLIKACIRTAEQLWILTSVLGTIQKYINWSEEQTFLSVCLPFFHFNLSIPFLPSISFCLYFNSIIFLIPTASASGGKIFAWPLHINNRCSTYDNFNHTHKPNCTFLDITLLTVNLN